MSERPERQRAREQLNALWADVDEVDHSLLALLESRLEIYREIGAQLEILEGDYDLDQREGEVLAQLMELAQDDTLKRHLPTVYGALSAMHLSTLPERARAVQDNEGDDQQVSSALEHDLSGTEHALARPKTRRKMTRLLGKQLGRFKQSLRSQRGAARSAPLTAEQRAWITERGFAHRGLHDALRGIAENSLTSFEAAVAQGYGVELDVHLSSDGVPVVFHDEELARMTGVEGEVGEWSLEELKTLKLIPSDDPIPTLAEALSLIGGQTPVLVEIKNHGKPVGPTESAVYEVIKEYNGPLCVQSFNPMSLSWFVRNAPHVLRGLISYSFPVEEVPLKATTRFLLKNLLFTPLCKPHYIAYRHSDLAHHRLKRLHRMRARGTPVLAWTILTQEEADLARHRVDNVIFEGFHLDHSQGD